MASRTHFIQPFFLQPSALQQNNFKNHQKWEIDRDPDFSTGSPLVRLKDSHGIIHEVKEFILENLDSKFENALTGVTTPEGKEQIICEYLCQRLANATSFQVHVETFCDEETHKSHYCLRLGGHGLKGGGDDDELLGGGKKTALGLSAVQICAGIIIIMSQHSPRQLKLSSWVLLSMGTAGISYFYRLKTDQKFTWSQWSAHTAFGAISCVVSEICGYLSQGANSAIRVFGHTVGSVIGNGVSNAIAYRLEDKPLDKKFVQSMGTSAVGGLVSASTGEVFNIFHSENDGLLKTVGLQVLKGTTSSILSKYSTHYCEEKEMAWQDYMEAVVLGGGLSALTAFADFWRSSSKLQELYEKKTKAEQQLAETKDRQTVNELTAVVLYLKKSYEVLSQGFEDKIRTNLNKGMKVKIKGHTIKDPATIREALVSGERVKWAMKGASSDFHRIADQLFEKGYSLGMKYREGLHRLSREMRALIQMENRLELYQTELGMVTGFLGHSEGSLSDFSVASDNSRSSSSYSAGTQAVQSCPSQQISNLKLQMNGLQALLPKARQQVELGRSYIAKLEGEIKALGHNIKEISIENVQAFQNNNSSWLPKSEINLKSHVSESPPVNAFKPKPIVSIPPEEALKELIEHVVLVQAISPEAFCHYPEADWGRAYAGTEEAKHYQAICSLKGVLNRQGVVGHHLDFTKKEFREKLIDRPHTHWSWNQLVQPNSGGKWENAGVAMLEPLSTVENTIHHKPFGICKKRVSRKVNR